MRRARSAAALALVVGVTATLVGSAAAHKKNPGFKTPQAAMLTPVAPGVTVEPLITVGETLPGTSYKFESIPDGIAVRKRHHGYHNNGGTVDVYVNHETSTVPFPFTASTGVGFNDFTNAMLSKLTLNRKTAGVLAGEYTIRSEQNYHRFCSNTLVGSREGFHRPLLFTNEEATDWVFRTGTSWPAPTAPPAEQAGVVAAHDVRTGETKSIYGMGRHNHENTVGVPGYGYPVLLSGDDTFTAPASQMYLYTARNGRAVWNDQGQLWAFVSDNAGINDYGDLSGSASVSGHFIQVPRMIAVGKGADGSDLKAADVGYPAPPSGVVDGPQWVLEHWSNTNNVFQFIRIEDIQYDRKNPRILYFADTGEPRAKPSPTTGRLFRDTTGGGPYPNGRIFKMQLDRRDPTKVKSLSILIDGDVEGASGAGKVHLIHQPDNVETAKNLLLVQEDPGSHNQYPATSTTGTTARLWGYDLKAGGAPFVIAKVDQSADEGPTDEDAVTAKANLGAWESSGVVDASKAFGKGAFLVDVQAGSLIVEEEVRGTLTYQREGGQLLLVRLQKSSGGDHRSHGKNRGKHDGRKGGKR